MDASIGRNIDGEKLYNLDGYDVPQVLGHGFRIVRRKNGYTLQKLHYGKGRGEFTQSIWADIPIVDESGRLIGYEMEKKRNES